MDWVQYVGLWLLVALSFNMWGWLSVIQSGSSWLTRGFWTAVLFLLPGLGFIGWFMIGPRHQRG